MARIEAPKNSSLITHLKSMTELNIKRFIVDTFSGNTDTSTWNVETRKAFYEDDEAFYEYDLNGNGFAHFTINEIRYTYRCGKGQESYRSFISIIAMCEVHE